MASIAGWWAIPAVAFVGVVIWTMWRGRTPKPLGMRDSVARYEHFQAVLTRVVAAEPPTPSPQRSSGPRAAAGENAHLLRNGPAAKHTKNHRPGGATDWAADRLVLPDDPNAAEPRAAAHGDVP